MPQSFSRHRR